MIKLFDIQNSKVIPTEHCYTLKSLKAIMEEYPDDYLKVYQYIFYMTSQTEENNPFFHMTEEDKEELIIEELDIDFSLDEPVIQRAIEVCNKLFETETSRAYYAIKKALDNMADYLNTTKFRDGKDGNVTQILSLAKQFNDVRQSYKGIYSDLKDEQASVVRGDQSLAYDQI
jgi:hypothetical protein